MTCIEKAPHFWQICITNIINNNIFLKKFLEDMSPFCGATDTPILDFWWRLFWVSKPEWVLPYSSLAEAYLKLNIFDICNWQIVAPKCEANLWLFTMFDRVIFLGSIPQKCIEFHFKFVDFVAFCKVWYETFLSVKIHEKRVEL